MSTILLVDVDVGSFSLYKYVPIPWAKHTKTTIRGDPSLRIPRQQTIYFLSFLLRRLHLSAQNSAPSNFSSAVFWYSSSRTYPVATWQGPKTTFSVSICHRLTLAPSSVFLYCWCRVSCLMPILHAALLTIITNNHQLAPLLSYTSKQHPHQHVSGQRTTGSHLASTGRIYFS